MTDQVSWTRFFDEHPISGSTTAFETLSQQYGTLETNIDAIVAGLDNYQDGEIATFTGEAAHAFNELTEGVLGLLREVPGVAAEAKTIFENHHTELVELQSAADEALNRAQTNWNTYVAAKKRNDDAKSSIDGQVVDLEDLQTWEDNAEKDFRTSINASHRDLKIREGKLDVATAQKLDELDVGKLQDPGFWDKVGSAIVDGLVLYANIVTLGNFDELVNLFNAVMEGDLWAALWALKDILDSLVAVLAIVAIIAGSPLTWIVLGLAVAAFAATVALYVSQEADPNSGRVASGSDVVWSGINVAGALVGVKFGGILDITKNLQAGMGLRSLTHFRSGGVIALDTFADVSTFKGGVEFVIGDPIDLEEPPETLDNFLEIQQKNIESGDVEINDKNQVVIGSS